MVRLLPGMDAATADGGALYDLKIQIEEQFHAVGQDSDSAFSSTCRSLWRTPYHRSALLKPFRDIARGMLPSFLKAPASPPNSTTAKVNSSSNIAALDGLRGLACLFVFNEHLTYNLTNNFLLGYGVYQQRTIIQLPFIRLAWSGFSMVAIFYVISGYVLSYKPLKQVQARETDNFSRTLTSSVGRRAMRLYLPAITAVLICGLLVSMGAFNKASAVYVENQNPFHLHERPPPILDNILLQMADAFRKAIQMLDVWNWSNELAADDYDRHLWTIVVEFRCSMVLFLLILGTSRLKQAYRLLAECLSIVYCIITVRSDVVLFICGMLIADLDLIRMTSRHTVSQTRSVSLPKADRLWVAVFAVGLYLSSIPTIGCSTTKGYITLSSLVPSMWEDKAGFIRSIGAILITWSVANSKLIQPIFTNSFTLYLGKISYALYLVHGNVLKSLQYASMPLIYRITNDGTKQKATTGGQVVAWLLGVLITGLATFWISDLFWRYVDMPSVSFARWVEEKVSDDLEEFGSRDRYPS